MVASPTWTSVTDTWATQTAFWNGWYTVIIEPDITISIEYDFTLTVNFLLWFAANTSLTSTWTPEGTV